MDFPLKNMFDVFKDEIWEGKASSIVLYYAFVALEKLCWATLDVHVHTHL